MTTVLAFLVMLVIVAAMAVGVLAGRKPIQGSCGGLAQLGVKGSCEICGGRPEACESSGPVTRKLQDIDAVDVGSRGRKL